MFDLKLEQIKTLALYIHIPFCATKCVYCDFNTYEGLEKLIDSYINALNIEIQLWGTKLHRPQLSTLFFGGGTPSYLNLGQITELIQSISQAFQIESTMETTLEANPEDIRAEKLDEYQRAGINRLSIGVQSLDDRLLKMLGRRHDAKSALNAIEKTLNFGFENASMDLMYGLPTQSLQDWKETLDTALSLGLPHLSIYCLGLEKGTPMAQSVDLGELPEPDPDLAAEMYELTVKKLDEFKYRHYEISNWAKPGFESQHNINYWNNQSFLGLGPGAHSYIPGFRFSNIKSPREYILRMENNPNDTTTPRTLRNAIQVIDQVENISETTEILDTLMMGLRLDTGVSEAAYFNRFGHSLDEKWNDTIVTAISDGLIKWENDSKSDLSNRYLQLTQKGKILSNEVLARFFAVAKN
ncbi:MAG: coproporphyrinogen III oxidase [Chloroflexi bacterium]|nr:coproporphyrinogen III oxidase [Chloroflexota bacterium]|tara:strand:- start:862 stop:2097 length:1236 start_codon:yes stop_codon:yes gene_type:complete